MSWRLPQVLTAFVTAAALAGEASAQPAPKPSPDPRRAADAVTDVPPAFTSVSITPHASGAPGPRLNLEPGGRFVATGVTLRSLVEMAYRRHGFDPRRVSGGPAWVETERFDVTAQGPRDHVFDADGYPRSTLLMLQGLLADRFRLKVRQETAEGPGYALVLTRSDGPPGAGLTRSAVDCADFMSRLSRAEAPAGGPQCGFGPYPRRLVGRAVTMRDLAGYLSMLLKRPVVDRTGLAGNFDLEVEGVEVVQPGPPGPSTRPSNTTRSIVEMLPEQVGLKLRPTTAPVETLVIEHAEKP